ncbi:MAG TPA: hypothetical protein PLJ35_21260 [Anaerolineae bacterium]|nr:hypothetical protein [Anaerolineae bacterium]HOR01352.1 hypothetical protein [Anaerolineae bacterium]HPL30113.1 hypothetical protein [Anaerolineae bacterium]
MTHRTHPLLRLLIIALAAIVILQPAACSLAAKAPGAKEPGADGASAPAGRQATAAPGQQATTTAGEAALDPALQAYLQGFAGTWDSTYGLMTLTVSGNKVSGSYEYREGKIEATLSADGRTMEGWWTELPSRQPPGDAGRMTFALLADGTIDGQWWFGKDGDGGEWIGTRVAAPGSDEPQPEETDEPSDEPEPGETDEPEPEETDAPSAGTVRPPSEPGLTVSSNPNNDLLFYVTKDDLSRIYYYGAKDGPAMRLSHITLDDGAGNQSIVIYNSQLLPVQWILPALTLAVYPAPDEEAPEAAAGAWFDPSRAFHVVMGEEEKTLTADIRPGDLAVLIDDMEAAAGQSFRGARAFLAEHDVTFDELVGLAQKGGPDQPLYIAAAAGFGAAAAALGIEQGGSTASARRTPGLAAPHAVVFGEAAKIGASALGGVLAGAMGASLDPGDGPGVGVLLCRGAAKYGVCHYMFYHGNRLNDCVANCQTSLGCFTDICMPMDISAELASSLGGAMAGR